MSDTPPTNTHVAMYTSMRSGAARAWSECTSPLAVGPRLLEHVTTEPRFHRHEVPVGAHAFLRRSGLTLTSTLTLTWTFDGNGAVNVIDPR